MILYRVSTYVPYKVSNAFMFIVNRVKRRAPNTKLGISKVPGLEEVLALARPVRDAAGEDGRGRGLSRTTSVGQVDNEVP